MFVKQVWSLTAGAETRSFMIAPDGTLQYSVDKPMDAAMLLALQQANELKLEVVGDFTNEDHFACDLWLDKHGFMWYHTDTEWVQSSLAVHTLIYKRSDNRHFQRRIKRIT